MYLYLRLCGPTRPAAPQEKPLKFTDLRKFAIAENQCTTDAIVAAINAALQCAKREAPRPDDFFSVQERHERAAHQVFIPSLATSICRILRCVAAVRALRVVDTGEGSGVPRRARVRARRLWPDDARLTENPDIPARVLAAFSAEASAVELLREVYDTDSAKDDAADDAAVAAAAAAAAAEAAADMDGDGDGGGGPDLYDAVMAPAAPLIESDTFSAPGELPDGHGDDAGGGGDGVGGGDGGDDYGGGGGGGFNMEEEAQMPSGDASDDGGESGGASSPAPEHWSESEVDEPDVAMATI